MKINYIKKRKDGEKRISERKRENEFAQLVSRRKCMQVSGKSSAKHHSSTNALLADATSITFRALLRQRQASSV